MTLLTQIQALPPELLATQDTTAIAAALPPVVTGGSVSRSQFSMWAAGNGMRGKIEDAATDTTSPLRSAALAIRDVLLGAADGIDFGIAGNQQMLGAWVAMGQMAQADADDLLALATVSTPVDEMTVRRVCWSDDGVWQV